MFSACEHAPTLHARTVTSPQILLVDERMFLPTAAGSAAVTTYRKGTEERDSVMIYLMEGEVRTPWVSEQGPPYICKGGKSTLINQIF